MRKRNSSRRINIPTGTTERPIEKEDLGEGMVVIKEDVNGWWKPRYLVDSRAHTQIEFISPSGTFCTVTENDIAWDSLTLLDEDCKRRARELDTWFPTIICNYRKGVAEVRWQLNPDGFYYMDEDGFGMTPDEEVELYGFIDRRGRVVSKFRDVAGDLKRIAEMRKEAENIVKKGGNI